MRHGNNTLVEGNVFFGNGADHTGGIRVINAGQTVQNNYMEGLKGTRFGGALVVMNGVPNGPINRYDPVINAVIENNTLVDGDNIQLGAGSDEERSGPPSDSVFANNLIYHGEGRDVFTVYDDMSGIDFKDNILNHKELPEFSGGFKHESVKKVSVHLGTRKQNLLSRLALAKLIMLNQARMCSLISLKKPRPVIQSCFLVAIMSLASSLRLISL